MALHDQNNFDVRDQAVRSCIQCGACLEVCPVYQAGRREDISPRGKLRILAGARRGLLENADFLTPCLLCGRCSEVCTNKTPACQAMQAGRQAQSGGAYALARLLAGPALAYPERLKQISRLAGLSQTILKKIPWHSGLRLRLPMAANLSSLPSIARRPALQELPRIIFGPKGAPKAAFFMGCMANYMRVDLARKAVAMLAEHYTVLLPEQGCCGLPALSAGLGDAARSLANKAVKSLFDAKPDLLITTCASCAYSLKEEAPKLLGHSREALAVAAMTREITQVLAENSSLLDHYRAQEEVALHNPCHARLGLGMQDEARHVLSKTGAQISPLSPAEACCGGGGLLPLMQPGLSHSIISPQAEALKGQGQMILATYCSGCFLQWQSAIPSVVKHPLELLDKA